VSLAPGARLGPYEVTAHIGTGGMGEVWRALDTRLGRPVALKLIRDAITDPDARARLEREARLAASISHPAICQVYELAEIDGQLVLAMELPRLPTWERMIDMLKRHEIQVLRRADHTWSEIEITTLSGVSEKTARRIAAEDPVATVDNAAERARRQVGRPSTTRCRLRPTAQRPDGSTSFGSLNTRRRCRSVPHRLERCVRG
jgi:Protein kinase domain